MTALESAQLRANVQDDYLKTTGKLPPDSVLQTSAERRTLEGEIRTYNKDVDEANEMIFALEAELGTKRPPWARSLPILPASSS